MDLYLTNSRTRTKERFEPLDSENVRMYVCGPTVYDRAHLGNARPVIVFDVLYRLLRHVYGADHVTYVRNFTDVDDKINARAAESGRSIGEITAETTQWFLDDMGAVGALEPDHMPRATAYIPQMVAMIEDLITKGFAYVKAGHVLFRVRKYEAYGALSGRSVDDMIAGARVEVAPFKEDPMDFVLWKPSGDDLPGWESPWGRGRPGWHIECSAMAKALLGETFDIHGGGNDLMFPHHENEIAQSCCANETERMAQVWLHNEMLQVEGKKMSKSLGNFFTVRDLLDQGVPGEVIRFVMLSTHYRKPMDWTEKKRAEAEATLRKWSEALARHNSLLREDADPRNVSEDVLAALADDLNTSLALTRLRDLAKSATGRDPGTSEEHALDEHTFRQFLDTIDLMFGIDMRAHARTYLASSAFMFDAERAELDEIFDRVSTTGQLNTLEMRLESLRNQALKTKDFSQVDIMKAALIAAGLEVRMSKTGVELVPGADFDAAKLEALE